MDMGTAAGIWGQTRGHGDSRTDTGTAAEARPPPRPAGTAPAPVLHVKIHHFLRLLPPSPAVRMWNACPLRDAGEGWAGLSWGQQDTQRAAAGRAPRAPLPMGTRVSTAGRDSQVCWAGTPRCVGQRGGNPGEASTELPSLGVPWASGMQQLARSWHTLISRRRSSWGLQEGVKLGSLHPPAPPQARSLPWTPRVQEWPGAAVPGL